MFGGALDAGPVLADTWEWDGVAGTWVDRTPATGNPPARQAPVIAYDGVGLLLFGGGVGNSAWRWSGGAVPCPDKAQQASLVQATWFPVSARAS